MIECKSETGATPSRSLGVSQASPEMPANSQPELQNTITAEGVLRVVARLEAAEAQRFERDLMHYNRTGERTEFILHVLAKASAEQQDEPGYIAA